MPQLREEELDRFIEQVLLRSSAGRRESEREAMAARPTRRHNRARSGGTAPSVNEPRDIDDLDRYPDIVGNQRTHRQRGQGPKIQSVKGSKNYDKKILRDLTGPQPRRTPPDPE